MRWLLLVAFVTAGCFGHSNPWRKEKKVCDRQVKASGQLDEHCALVYDRFDAEQGHQDARRARRDANSPRTCSAVGATVTCY